MKNLSDRLRKESEDEKEEIKKFFLYQRNGVCVEVGSNEPKDLNSQSYYLEKDLDWKCFLVEANPELVEKTKKCRPKAKILNYACVEPEKNGKQLSLFIPLNESDIEISGHASVEKNIDEHNYKKFREVIVEGRTLSDTLKIFKVEDIDILSIDVEGYEYEVLSGIDFDMYSPKLILLEDKNLYLNKHNLLIRKGYKLVRRLNRNSWYLRDDIKGPSIAFSHKVRMLKRVYLSLWYNKIKYAFKHKTIKSFTKL